MVIGVLAHVDAGKTTCIEAMSYLAGSIRSWGRVDHGDSLLDYDEQERERGITIYAKEACLSWKDTTIQILDTPGHVDFSSEMERTLRVIDLAVLVISGPDGIQSHTETILRCLEHYNVPCMIFVNKMDICYRSEEEILLELQKKCGSACLRADTQDPEQLAMCSEELLETYLESGEIDERLLQEAFAARKYIPVIFGSALKRQNVDALLDTVAAQAGYREYPEEFGARVYRISQDTDGSRLTHIKVTGGTLHVRDRITEDEKADAVRIYNGTRFDAVNEVSAGMICTLKGISSKDAGSGLGFEEDEKEALLSACMTYEILCSDRADVLKLTRICRQIETEDPQLQISTDESGRHLYVQIMGDMQKEVLRHTIEKRSGIAVDFGPGRILYAETIAEEVIGSGHFEPLRHYAEVHLRLTPLQRGSGLVIDSECPRDVMTEAWQASVLSALRTVKLRGILTNSPLSDLRITLIAGRGHLKHTEAGDFRQAAMRALRQGLYKSENILLEPYCSYTLRIPADALSHALYDMERMHASAEVAETADGIVYVHGSGAVRLLMNYASDLAAYSHGKGVFSWEPGAYDVCQDPRTVIDAVGYDPDADRFRTPDSVFCANGSGYIVPWNLADEHMHVQLKTEEAHSSSSSPVRHRVSNEELKRVFDSTFGNNRSTEKKTAKKKEQEEMRKPKAKPAVHKPGCLIVDGYNMIYDWQDLRELAKDDISTARERLIDRLYNYQAFRNEKMILVFDGYRRKDNAGSSMKRGDMEIVYTRADETADSYIERISLELKDRYAIRAATSDGLIQNAVLAHGGLRMSARELEQSVLLAEKQISEVLG